MGLIVVPFLSLAAVLLALGSLAHTSGLGRGWALACVAAALPPVLGLGLVTLGPAPGSGGAAGPVLMVGMLVSAPCAAVVSMVLAIRLRDA